MSDGLCECGCGQAATRRFVKGHNRRRAIDDRYVVDASGCWVWDGAMYGNGYGQLHLKRNGIHFRVRAHRFFYERVHGPIPERLTIDHLCRNPRCVNPDHLEAVTQAENNRRAVTTKLTLEAARDIRSRAEDSPADLAEEYGVSQGAIYSVLSGQSWKDASPNNAGGN